MSVIAVSLSLFLVPHAVSYAKSVSLLNWNEGWKAWKNGEPEEALSWWSKAPFAAEFAPRPARLYYWRIKALERLGRVGEAASLKNCLAERFPFDFYTFMLFPDGGASVHPRKVSVKAEALFFPCPWAAEVSRASRYTGVQERMIWAVMKRESKFRANAVSQSGARGLMQLMPGTAEAEARSLNMKNVDITLPDQNILLGANHFARLEKRFGMDLPRAVAAYNAGSAAVVRWNTLSAGDWVEWVEEIPYAETREFVRSVLENREVYRLVRGAAGEMPLMAFISDSPMPIGNIASLGAQRGRIK